MTSGAKTIIYPVRDLANAKAVFSALVGSEPNIDMPYYVQYDLGDQRLGLDPSGHARGFTGSVCYWEVGDIRERVKEMIAAGAEEHEAVRDVGGGTLIASVKDADGVVIGLKQSV